MPLDAWVLLVVSIGLGLGIELAYMRARLRERSDEGGRRGAGKRPGGRR